MAVDPQRRQERYREGPSYAIDRVEDQRLMRRHRAGDQRAREQLIMRYLPLARRLAMRYRHTSEPVDDLVQVAFLSLVKAVDRWDPDRGFAFSTFAVPTILGELRRYFRDATWHVRPPRQLQELCVSVGKSRTDLIAATGEEPTIGELADRLGRSREDIVEALQAGEARSVRSLDDEPNDDGRSVGDLLGENDGGYELAEARATIERLNSILDARAREVLRLRFEEDLPQSEIGERLGCSQMHVSRIIRRSLEALHEHSSISCASSSCACARSGPSRCVRGSA